MVDKISGVTLKADINKDMQINSHTANAKKLNKVAIIDKLILPLLTQINAINNKIINTVVWIPKGMANDLTTKAVTARIIPNGTIFLTSMGILAITKARVTTAICSGIPCTNKEINGILIDLTTSHIVIIVNKYNTIFYKEFFLRFLLLHIRINFIKCAAIRLCGFLETGF
ncbi:MAG: hypothetical protein PHV03_07935, partial [Desulfitobacteriaceae bacterium]|nr:hypothetical protein [Desulfitobacteriaceae bacterium]